MREILQAYFKRGRGVFHRRLADLLVELDGRQGEAADHLRLAAVLVSQRLEQGDVCLALEQFAGRAIFTELALEDAPPLRAPELEPWLASLSDSAVVTQAGAEPRPLLLDSNSRLYLYRYWQYEQRLAAALHARAADTDLAADKVRAQLDRVFEPPGSTVDWQRVAAALAVRRRLSVITGGAGTGKTTTVVKILVALRQLEGEGLRIALAAPTGKAAARLSESIRQAKNILPLSADELEAVPEDASTIHRLLGVRLHSSGFHHHADNPLPVDCLVLDEASMVDLALMCKLAEALPAEARLIMLGDPYQLAAVEAGSVLSVLAQAAANRFSPSCREWLALASGADLPSKQSAGEAAAMADTTVELQVTHRFAGHIGVFATAIRQGQAERALQVLDDADVHDVRWHTGSAGSWLDADLLQELKAWFDGCRHAEPRLALQQLDAFRILCAHREGATGVEAVNALIEQHLRREGLIRGGTWYPGRPVMVTRNDHALRLYNGDVGLCLANSDGELQVWFPADEQPRAFAPGRLPAHESVFAMTVHKTQGSEFGSVLLLLPDHLSPIVDRALLYTAVTRARKKVLIHGNPALLRAACRATGRHDTSASSGLLDALKILGAQRDQNCLLELSDG